MIELQKRESLSLLKKKDISQVIIWGQRTFAIKLVDKNSVLSSFQNYLFMTPFTTTGIHLPTWRIWEPRTSSYHSEYDRGTTELRGYLAPLPGLEHLFGHTHIPQLVALPGWSHLTTHCLSWDLGNNRSSKPQGWDVCLWTDHKHHQTWMSRALLASRQNDRFQLFRQLRFLGYV